MPAARTRERRDDAIRGKSPESMRRRALRCWPARAPKSPFAPGARARRASQPPSPMLRIEGNPAPYSCSSPILEVSRPHPAGALLIYYSKSASPARPEREPGALVIRPRNRRTCRKSFGGRWRTDRRQSRRGRRSGLGQNPPWSFMPGGGGFSPVSVTPSRSERRCCSSASSRDSGSCHLYRRVRKFVGYADRSHDRGVGGRKRTGKC